VSAKLLLVRTGSAVFHAKALIATASGIYDREIENESALAATFQSEKFDLIICDGRHKDQSVLELVEKIRGHQADAHIVLLCEKPQLDFIVKAIRLGVRDLFHPPVNLAALLARADELLKPAFADAAAGKEKAAICTTAAFSRGGVRPRPCRRPARRENEGRSSCRRRRALGLR